MLAEGKSRSIGSHLWRRGAVAAAYTTGALLPVFLFGANSVSIQDDLAFGTRELGFAVAAYFGAGGLIAARIGVLIDRIGTRASLRIGMAFSLAASAIIAMVANSWWIGAIGMASCGVAHAFTQLALNRMLVEGGTLTNGALAFGLKQAAVPVASLLAGFATATLVPQVTWRSLYLVAAIISVGLAISVPTDSPTGSGRVYERSARPGRLVRRLAVGASLAAGAGNAVSLLIVDTFDANGFTASTGAVVLTAGSALAATSRIGGGWLAGRRESSGFQELRVLLATGAVGFLILSISGNSLLLITTGSLIAFLAGWGWQGIVFFAATRDGRVPPATASGVVLSGTMSGSVVGPIAIGAVANAVGYGPAWGIGALALALSAVVMPVSAPGGPTEHDKHEGSP